ncbi:ricin-type beta-trefoil lectin domain protein [Micromonospora sp. NPDC049523]|uniref:ricin-type beta-trefoil lectin domain protein n=1 Tax=Micromonospora sp. NPDC049523 TaxID=3155921 RepID=UPI0034262C28
MRATAGGEAVRRLGGRAVAAVRRWTGTLRLPVRHLRLGLRLRRAVAITAVLGLVGVCAVAAGSGFGDATAQEAGRAASPVPVAQVSTIAAAALSCPALSPAKVAAQLMAASGFEVNLRANSSGGSGIAALTDSAWQSWAPWPRAPRLDIGANIFALAHHMCDLVGQVRRTGVDGDPWRLALAAYRSGLPAVRTAGGVPAAARGYVDTVAAYATWYERQPDLTSGSPSPTPRAVGAVPTAGTAPIPVPDAYLPLVLAAGQVCGTVTPARVAGQLMASSGFNPNLLSAGGGQGIAQFLPQTWARYAPPTASPWDPQTAIPALGQAMCVLTRELSGIGPDPYPMALAAYHWGSAVVQQAGGLPDSPGLREHTAMVLAYADHYAHDPRLGGPPAGAPLPHPGSPAVPPPVGSAPPQALPPAGAAAPPAVPPAVPPAAPPVAPPVAAAPPPAAPPAPKPPADPPKANPTTTKPAPSGVTIHGYVDKCIDAPGSADGTPLRLWSCNGSANQRWTFASDGSVRAFGKCMDAAWASTADGTTVQLAVCNGGPAQRFTLNGAHDLVNKLADKCVDVRDWNTANGARLQLWQCSGDANQKWWRG